MGRRGKIAIGTLIVVVVGGTALFFFARYMFTKIVIVAPGAGGTRIHEHGVFANYFPASKRGAAVLLLGGSEGGIGKSTNDEARAFHAKGYSVLALSYFGAPGEPKYLELVPLETFDRGLAWLRARPEVDPGRIGIMGVSKGAEAALLVATRHPELRAVVAGVPSSVVWPGIKFPSLHTPSSWTLHGRPLPVLPYGAFRFSMLRGDIGSVYRDGLKHFASHPSAAIQVEKIEAPVLLICGRSDKLWPSCPMSRQVEARAQSKGGPSVTVLAYSHAGHSSIGVPTEKDLWWTKLLLGGTDAGNQAARSQSWPRITSFVAHNLRG